MMSGIEGFASLDEAAAAIAAYTPNRKRKANPAGLQKVLRLKRTAAGTGTGIRASCCDGTEVPGADFEELFEVALSHIRVPTLLVRGKLGRGDRRGRAGLPAGSRTRSSRT